MVQILYEQSEVWSEDEVKTIRIPALEVEVKIAPDVARRRANDYLITYVSMTLHAVDPRLIVAEQPYWRFTLEMRLRELGRVADLGTLDIDALTGDVVVLQEQQIRNLQEQANEIVTRLTRRAA